MNKQKQFYVSWDERHSAIIEAKNKEEAIEKAKNGEFDYSKTDATYQGNTDAFEIKNNS